MILFSSHLISIGVIVGMCMGQVSSTFLCKKIRYFGSLVGKWLPEVFTSRTANIEKHEVAG